MHKILLLNDFSENAGVALHYAARLAEAHGAILTQVACNAEAVLPLHHGPEDVEVLSASLEAFSSEIGPQVEMEHLGIWLETAEAVCNFAEDIRAGLIVAPESNPYSVTLARELARTSVLSIMLVPANAVFMPIKKILFAASFQFNDLLALNMLRRWVQVLDAKLDIVYVPESENQVEEAAEKMGALAEMLGAGMPFAFQLLKVGEPGKAILEYLLRENVAVLALTTHRRSAWKAFFDSSVSEYLLRECPAPLLLIKDLEDSV